MSEARAYLGALCDRLHALLGTDLVGVYAGGSFALGGYQPGRSDLDVAVVCRCRLSDGRKAEIGAAVRHESLPCPARGLELVVYAEQTVRRGDGEAGYELNLNSGRAMPYLLSLEPEGEGLHWYAIDRAIVRRHGVVLVGPPASELFAAIPQEVLLLALCESVRWYEGSVDSPADDAVLNACRAWQFAAEGVWSSKLAAGDWARQRLTGTMAGLVADAAARRLDGEALGRERVEPFLRFVSGLVCPET